MQISKEKLDEFKVLYRKHFGVELTDAEVLDKGSRLVRLLKVAGQGYVRYIKNK